MIEAVNNQIEFAERIKLALIQSLGKSNKSSKSVQNYLDREIHALRIRRESLAAKLFVR